MRFLTRMGLTPSTWEKLKYHTEKQFILATLFLGSSIFFWMFLFTAFLYRTTSGFVIFLSLLLGLIWLSIASFSVVFLRLTLFYFVLGGTSIFLVISFGIFDFLNIIGIAFLILSFILARKRAEKILGYLARFKGVYVFRKSLGILFTGIAIFLSFSYYTLIVEDFVGDEPSIPRDVYQSIFSPVDYVLEKGMPGYSRGMTVSQFQEAFFDTFPLFEPLTGEPEDDFVAQEPIWLQEEVAEQTLEEFTYNYINTNVRAMIEPYWGFASAFLILALFLAIRFFLFPLLWITIGVLLVALRILVLYNIVEIKEYKVTKRSLVFE